MSKHTEGPWDLGLGGISGTFVVFQDGSQDAIATVWANYSEKENDANARLIAAAPDLLTAAEEALGILERCHEGWPPTTDELTSPILLLVAALAKARGEEE